MQSLEETYIEGDKIAGSKDAHEIAQKNGWRVVVPENNQLQLDIDDNHSYQIWAKHRNVIEKSLKITKVVETPSKSGKPGRCHITVDLDVTLKPDERIVLQALLGSDRTREILSWVNLKRNDESPTLFYEK